MIKYNYNDYFEYLYRSSFNTTFEIVEKYRNMRKKQIRECKHEFVLLRKGGWDSCYGFNSTDYVYDYNIIECVHCGVTNKYKETEMIMREPIGSIFPRIRMSVETEEFDLIFGKEYSDKYDVNLISSRVVNSRHAKLLYDIAKKVYPIANNQKLVEIIHILNLLETKEEKKYLNTVLDAKKLIIRYCLIMNHVLKDYKQSCKGIPKLVKRIK